jgi:DNA-binding MarR family transcriptional regulator
MTQRHEVGDAAGALRDQDYRDAAELRVALRTFMARSDQIIRRHGLTPKKYELLLLVQATLPAPVSVGAIARKLTVGQSAATQLVRRAERDHLLERTISREDARIHHLQLTAEGRRRLDAALAALGPERAELVRILSSLQG